MNDELKQLLEWFNSTGRVSHYYPRKQLVSLNGMKAIPVKQAVKRIKELKGE